MDYRIETTADKAADDASASFEKQLAATTLDADKQTAALGAVRAACAAVNVAPGSDVEVSLAADPGGQWLVIRVARFVKEGVPV